MAKTWQSRLQAVGNRLNQKLIDNSIRLAGDITDVIIIRNRLNEVSDIESRIIDSIDIIEIMLSPLKDVPLKVFSLDNPIPSPIAVDGVTSIAKPLFAHAPIGAKVDQDDIIVKFIENPSDIQPWILVLQVKEALGTFGSRVIQWQKYQLSYYDNVLSPTIKSYVWELANRRKILGW